MQSHLTPEQADLVTRFMLEHDVPGAAVALVRDGAPFACAGFGLADVAAGRAVGPDTLFPVASLTKSFTALAAMQQVEAGCLDLDAPVQTWLPGLRVHDEAFVRSLTLRRLLSHRGGLGRTGHQDRTREEAVNPFPDRASLVFALADAVPQSAAGRAFSYSNEGYAIAGHAVEVVAGSPLESLFGDRIHARCGMTRTAVSFARWRADPDHALPYGGAALGPFDSGQRHGRYTVARLNPDYRTFLATGGIVSSARDLACYQAATMDLAGRRLGLSPGGLDQMHCVQAPFGDTGWGYGLGWWVMWSGRRKLIGHSGGLPGVSNYSLMLPAEGAGVVVLTNRSDVKALLLAEALMNTLVGTVWREDASHALPLHSAYPAGSAAELAQYAGRFAFRKGEARVRAGDGTLTLVTPSRYDGPEQALTLLRVGPDCFVDLKLGACVAFYRDAAGQVSGFGFSGYGYRRVAPD